jgi:hypothetical protein
MKLKEPSAQTLKKYGLSLPEWARMAERQKHSCAVCGKLPSSGRLHIDHEHVKGWKKMAPENRRMYVRGLLCWTCNRFYCARGISIEKAMKVADYLKSYLEAWAAYIPDLVLQQAEQSGRA